MKYDRKVREAVHSIAVPVEGFRMDVVSFDTFVLLRFYYSQWAEYTERERERLLMYLDKVKRCLAAYGINAALDPVLDADVTLQET